MIFKKHHPAQLLFTMSLLRIDSKHALDNTTREQHM